MGLTCGGIIDIYVEPASKERFADLGEVAGAVHEGIPVAVATIIEGPGEIGGRRVIWEDGRTTGTLGAGARLDAAVDDDARGMLARGSPRCAGTDLMASAGVTSWPSSCSRSPRRRGCSSSARSTSRPQWRARQVPRLPGDRL